MAERSWSSPTATTATRPRSHYRNECRARAGKTDPLAASEFAMATFINTHSKGLTILPTHRNVANLPNFDFDRFRKSLAPYFDWYSYPFPNPEERQSACAEFRKDLEGRSHGRRAIGVYAGTGSAADSNEKPGPAFYLFALQRGIDLEDVLPDVPEAQRGLDVVLLHRLILEKGLGITPEAVAAEKSVGYERETDAALAAVDSRPRADRLSPEPGAREAGRRDRARRRCAAAKIHGFLPQASERNRNLSAGRSNRGRVKDKTRSEGCVNLKYKDARPDPEIGPRVVVSCVTNRPEPRAAYLPKL